MRRVAVPERGAEALFGTHDENLRFLEDTLKVRIKSHGSELIVDGDEAGVEVVAQIFDQLGGLMKDGYSVASGDVRLAAQLLGQDGGVRLRDYLMKAAVRGGKKVVVPRSLNQRAYLEQIEAHDMVFGIGPAGTGKCVSSDSLVLTDRGMVQIGELASHTRAGEAVPIDLTIHGVEGPESATHLYDGGEAETLKITTRLGYSIETTPEHPLLVLEPEARLAWRRADALRVGDTVVLHRGQCMFGNRVGLGWTARPNAHDHSSKPVSVETLDEDLAYVVGLIVGDGCLTHRNRVILTSADPEVVASFKALAARLGLHVFPNYARPYDHIIASSGLHRLLEHLGLSIGTAPTKRIPPAILAAPEPIVAAFLSGLFDADGTVDARDGLITLSTASPRLAREIQTVLLNFGIVAARGIKRGRYLGRVHVSERVTITGVEAERFDALIGFRLERKRSRRKLKAANTNVEQHKVFDDYRRGRRKPSYAKLEYMCALIEERGASEASWTPLKEVLSQQLLFLPVAEITPSRAHVYDLTVPETHSFVANGFVNHNTYLAVAQAVSALLNKQVARIVLARPAVEAGEKLGFLPGDLQEKVDPYLRPLYDALYDLLDYDKVSRLLERNAIEVAPIAFMRGRAQPLTSRILTHAGWREIGALKVGDCAIGSDGRPTPVLGVYPQGEKEVFRVTATDGASTLCCAEHLWSVKTPEDIKRGNSRILETRDMMGHLRRAHQHRYELPMLSGPVCFPRRDIPLDPYVLGLLLGDGCITGRTTPTFSTRDLELVESLGAGLEGDIEVRHKAGVDYVLRNALGRRGAIPNPVTVVLRDLGLCGTTSATKFVPDAYLYNTPPVRHALLQGLLDTDGGPVVQDRRTCRIHYGTNSPKLRDAVVFLARSLGGVAYWRTRTRESKRPGFANGRPIAHRTDSFVIDIRLPAAFPPFRLRRKAKEYAADGGGRPMRFIKSIEPAGTAETCCIRVGAHDSLYVTDDFLLTHNTLNDAFVIIDEAQNTTTEQMKMVLTRIGFGSKVVVTGDITQIDLPPGKISGLVDAISVLGGVEGISFVYFDEKDVVRHRLVQAVIKAYEAYGAAQTPGK